MSITDRRGGQGFARSFLTAHFPTIGRVIATIAETVKGRRWPPLTG
ncbi:MAG: hypothetical protein NNA23_01430 [Nitrospira sp.]|nr:hypothetical protein [Nitrospira sp.]